MENSFLFNLLNNLTLRTRVFFWALAALFTGLKVYHIVPWPWAGVYCLLLAPIAISLIWGLPSAILGLSIFALMTDEEVKDIVESIGSYEFELDSFDFSEIRGNGECSEIMHSLETTFNVLNIASLGLTIALITLKLLNHIDWSWVWIVIVPQASSITVSLMALFFLIFANFTKVKEDVILIIKEVRGKL